MFPKPADYPFWFRLVIVVSLAFFAVNLFFFVGPFVALVTGVRQFLGTKEIFTGIGTLFATFIGAWLAFRFASVQRDRERVKSEVAAGNRALFTLTVMYNETYQHQNEIIEQVRGRSDAWLNMPVTSRLSENLSFDIKDLSFLLQADSTIFQQVLLEEARFKLVASMIADHSSLNFTIIWPRMEAAGISRGMQHQKKSLRNYLEPEQCKDFKWRAPASPKISTRM